MTTDTDRINALGKMGNIAVWHGSWATHVPEKGGKQIRSISELDEDGTEVGDEIVRGETIRESIDNYMANTIAIASTENNNCESRELAEAWHLLNVLSLNMMDDGPTWPRVLEWLRRNEQFRPVSDHQLTGS